jgi:hypothetical protein
MNDTRKPVSVLFISVLSLLVGSFLFFSCALKPILFAGPHKARTQVPITYRLGWWTDQGELHVDSFIVAVVDSKLSLFNSKSLISYRIKGHLDYKGSWKPYIKEVHMSERFLRVDTLNNADLNKPGSEILITPVVFTKQDNTANGGSIPFDFTNEYTVTSYHWGVNRVKVKCGQMEETIELFQKK